MDPFSQTREKCRISILGAKAVWLSPLGLVLCAVLVLAGCTKVPVKPSEITQNDVCFHCKSPITDVAFAAEFITKDGFVRKFDDLACLIAHAKKIGRNNIVGLYGIDSQTKELFPVEE